MKTLKGQLEGLLTLRRHALEQVQGFQDHGNFKFQARPHWSQKLQRSNSKWTFMPGKTVSAHFGIELGVSPFYKVEVRQVHFDYALGEPHAQRWVLEQMRRTLSQPTDKDLILVPAAYVDVLPQLFDLGYGISELVLGGQPAHALKALEEHYGAIFPDPTEMGFACRSLEPQHARSVIAMQKQVFEERKDLCWFFASPGFAEGELTRLQTELGMGRAFGLFEYDDLVGYFSYSTKGVQSCWGKECGVDLCYQPFLQGRGLGQFAYRKMLPRMIEEKVAFFKGGTANPAVLKLSAIMGRPLLWLQLRRQLLCPDLQRFSSWVDLDAAPHF